MSTNFTSRTGLRPLVRKRAPGAVKVTTATDLAEFQALMLVMQEANLDVLGRFYGGAQLVYDKSVTQKVLAASAARLGNAATGRLQRVQAPATDWFVARARALARLVMRHEAAYLIDTVAASLYDRAASEIQDQLMDLALKSAPVVGLIKTGWDALASSGDALDKLVRTGVAHRHGIELAAGEPRAAAEAVRKLLARKAGLLAVSAGSSTAAFAVGVAAEAGSFGAATGTAELGTAVMQTVVDIILTLTQIIIDIIDFERGNKLLGNLPEIVNPTQDTVVKMFRGCPVLGCYMLATPIFPTSAFVYLMAKPGAIASVDEVERIAITHVNPLRLEASWLIRQATFRMSNPESKEANDKIRTVMSGASESEIQQALELRNLHREAAKDATKRSEYLDRSYLQQALDYAARPGASQYANNVKHGFGSDGQTHVYNRHEGKLHGLSQRIAKYKKSATASFITNTRLGKFLKEAEVIEETEAEIEAKKKAMRAPPPTLAAGPKPVGGPPPVVPKKPLPPLPPAGKP